MYIPIIPPKVVPPKSLEPLPIISKEKEDLKISIEIKKPDIMLE